MLTSKIVQYDPAWPQKYIEERDRIHQLANHAGIDIAPFSFHHVGSTAVPRLTAKPEIDIVLVVPEIAILTDLAPIFEALHYRRGSDLSAGHAFFKKDVNGVRTHKVHICQQGHPVIAEMIDFRNLLRADADLKLAYGKLKLRLERENEHGIKEYIDAKQPFIRAALAKARQPGTTTLRTPP